MECQYWSKTHPVCRLGLYGGMPSRGVCKNCISNNQNNEEYAKMIKCKQTGLGDIVHKIAQPIARTIDGALGTDLQNCGGCKNRRAALNRMFPFKAGTNH